MYLRYAVCGCGLRIKNTGCFYFGSSIMFHAAYGKGCWEILANEKMKGILSGQLSPEEKVLRNVVWCLKRYWQVPHFLIFYSIQLTLYVIENLSDPVERWRKRVVRFSAWRGKGDWYDCLHPKVNGKYCISAGVAQWQRNWFVMAKGQKRETINRPDVIFHVWAFFFASLEKKCAQLIEPWETGIERSTFEWKRDWFQEHFFQFRK